MAVWPVRLRTALFKHKLVTHASIGQMVGATRCLQAIEGGRKEFFSWRQGAKGEREARAAPLYYRPPN